MSSVTVEQILKEQKTQNIIDFVADEGMARQFNLSQSCSWYFETFW